MLRLSHGVIVLIAWLCMRYVADKVIGLFSAMTLSCDVCIECVYTISVHNHFSRALCVSCGFCFLLAWLAIMANPAHGGINKLGVW